MNRFFVLHLSDIHIKSTSEIAGASPAAIAAVLRPFVAAGADILVAVTGDIAFSGKADQYRIAATFLTELRGELKGLNGVCSVNYVIVPGNHDVDFSGESTVHSIVRNAATSKPAAIDGSMMKLLTSLQDSFFDFEAEVTGDTAPQESGRVYYVRRFTIDAGSLLVYCINTAWMSRLQEKPSELVFPVDTLTSTHEPAALSIALFHHPYNWLGPTNSRAFRHKVEQIADVILTGHEHETGAHERREFVGIASTYIEGAALHGDGTSADGFNVVEFDIGARRIRIHQYEANSGEFLSKDVDPPWQGFPSSKTQSSGEPLLSSEFESYLHDPGAPFTHTFKTKLTLDDLWIDIELQDQSFGRDVDAPGSFGSSEVFASESSNPRVMIVGADDSGKTSLAKHVYISNHAAGRLPLLMYGGDFKSADRDTVVRSIRQRVADQYGESAVERYLQRPAVDKILIVDDFDATSLNNRGQNELLEVLHDHFERLLLTVSDLFPIERLTDTGDERRPLINYAIFEIQELGHRQRGELIERWMTLGREQSTSDDDLVYDLTQVENSINTLLGKGLFPAYPMFVLAVLQTIEASSDLNTAELGTYGHVYDALIAKKLTAHLRGLSTDTKYTFLAEVAFRASDSPSFAISTDELRRVGDEFFAKYRIRVPLDDVLNEMVLAAILQRSGSDISFKYKYVFYYFIAKYYALNLLDRTLKDELRSRIRDLVAESHTEHAANVLLFLLYLTKDPDVIEEMLAKARTVFEDISPATFSDDVAFLGGLAGKPIILELPAVTASDSLRERQSRRDSHEVREGLNTEAVPGAEHELLQLNSAMKAVQILGQILRNFPGSLPGGIKYAVAQEVYAVGLRSVAAVLASLEEHLPELRVDIAAFLKERRNISDERLASKTDQFLFHLTVLFGYSLLKRVSFALGSEHLTETYKEVLAQSDSNAVSLIDMTIRLDHFRGLPISDLEQLAGRLHKSLYATSVLRRLVWDRLYFFPVSYKVKQKLCDLFNIYLSPRFHNTDRKRLVGRAN